MLVRLLPLLLVTGPICIAGCSGSNGTAVDAGHGGSTAQTSTGGSAGGSKGSDAGTANAAGGGGTAHPTAGKGGVDGGVADAGGTSSAANLIGSNPTEQYLSELIAEIDSSTSGIVKNAAGTSATAVFNLLGTDNMTITQADLVSACTDQTKPSTTCLGDLPSHTAFIVPGINECFQSGCASKGMSFVDVFITKGTMKDSSQRVSLSYSSSDPYPSAMISYAENPLTHWVTDATDPNNVKVSADVQGSITVKLDSDDSTIDLSYTGTISGQVAQGKVTYKIELTFPNVMSGGPVAVELNAADGNKTGQISMGSKSLATIQNDPLITWQ